MLTTSHSKRVAAGVGLALCALLPSTAAAQSEAGSGLFAIKAKLVHIGDGNTIENGVVTIEDGKIKSVGTKAGKSVRVVEVDGHLSPGLITLRDATGATSENHESARRMTPKADLSRAFDPDHPDWLKVLDQGITTVVLTPSSDPIAGGAAAIVSPAIGEVVKPAAFVSLGMSSRSISSFTEPTSYAGLYAMLREAFDEAAAGSPLASAKAGATPVLMEAVSRLEVLQAAAFAKELGLKGAIIGAPRAEDTLDAIKDSGLAVVFEPVSIGEQPYAAKSAIALEKAGQPFAFTSDANEVGPASMRMTAALFMRFGLGAKTALAAMTMNAADIAGVGNTHGTIAAGKVADLVVWSGDPTDLTSRVLQVYGGGRIVRDHMNSNSASGANR